jgi:DNA polymerase-3 subunit beta
MELTIPKGPLLKALARAQSIVERSKMMPILSNIMLDAHGEQVTITATDMEISFIGVYPARVSKSGRITVPARKFHEIVKELPAEEVYLKEKENGYLHITGGRAAYNLVGLSADNFPELPHVDGIPQLNIAGEVLAEMIEKTFFSISQEETRFNLAGLYVQKRKKDDGHRLRFVSTDGHRLSLIDKEVPGVGEFALETGVIIPRKGVAEMRKLSEEGGDLVLGLGQRCAVVKKNEVQLILRLQEGSFPDYEVVIPKNTKLKALVNRQAFEGVLRRVSLIATYRFQGVRLDFKEGLLEVVSNNPDMGEAREALEVAYEGQPFEVGFNARYFLDLCTAMRSEEISLTFVDEQNPCVIRGESDPGFLGVVMPMRL